jgi:hypothetical protein
MVRKPGENIGGPGVRVGAVELGQQGAGGGRVVVGHPEAQVCDASAPRAVHSPAGPVVRQNVDYGKLWRAERGALARAHQPAHAGSVCARAS